MKKLLAIIISILIPLALCSGYTNVSAFDVSKVSAKAAILIEAQTGKILYQKNASQMLQMASTTKIMTTLIALEKGNLDEYFIVDSNAIKVEGSSMGLKEGDRVTQRALCYGMMLPSGNDAANATAVRVAGSQEKFIAMMNAKAKKIGMKNTNFVTPSGLDDYTDLHYSTAYDMAILTREALRNPIFKEICSTKNAKLEFGNPPFTRWLQNTNRLIGTCQGVIGVKTGFTDKAKRCLVSACERNGITLICVTLNDPNDWNDHANLYEYGFSKFGKVEMPIDNINMIVNVVGGKREIAYLKQKERVTLSVAADDVAKVKKVIILPQFAYAPLKKGDVVGRADYVLNGTVIKSVPIIAEEDVAEFYKEPKKSVWQFIKGLFGK